MAVSNVRIEPKNVSGPRSARRGAANSPYAADSTSNVNVLYGSAGYPTISDTANAQYQTAGLAGRVAANSNQAPQSNNQGTGGGQTPVGYAPSPSYQTSSVVRPLQKKKKRTVAQKTFTKAKVSAVSPWIFGWSIFWYTTVQLPFAVISTAGLGIAAAIYTSISKFLGDGFTAFLVNNIEDAFVTFSGAIAAASKLLFGISFDPILIFFIPFLLVFTLGALQLMVCWFIYGVLGIRSLSGQASGIKTGLFVLALVGVCIPILNLFPLLLFWTGFVWLKPR